MNDDLITRALAAHEADAPDGREVLGNADRLARRYRRRRRTAQATGAAVLGVSVAAGAVNAPSLFHGGSGTPQARVFATDPSSPHVYTDEQARNEFWNDGYDYHNATDLARLWHMNDISAVKATAGRKLLDHETLPVEPANEPAAPEDKDADQATAAFFDAGYTYDDAIALGQKWNMPDTYQVKVKAGHKVENGEPLPVQPSGK